MYGANDGHEQWQDNDPYYRHDDSFHWSLLILFWGGIYGNPGEDISPKYMILDVLE